MTPKPSFTDFQAFHDYIMRYLDRRIASANKSQRGVWTRIKYELAAYPFIGERPLIDPIFDASQPRPTTLEELDTLKAASEAYRRKYDAWEDALIKTLGDEDAWARANT